MRASRALCFELWEQAGTGRGDNRWRYDMGFRKNFETEKMLKYIKQIMPASTPNKVKGLEGWQAMGIVW